MPFRFPLQSILKLRQSLEHQEELRLRLVNQAFQRLRHQIELIGSRRSNLEEVLSIQIASGTTGAEIILGLEAKKVLEQQRKELEAELSRINAVREQQRQRFEEARLKREMLSNLREQAHREFDRHISRQQQRELDDVFLSRLAKRESR